ncbi:MAG: cytochrome c oxidase assembly protein [Acidimicrobiales bacterium]
MNYIFDHWSFDPVLIVVIATVLCHELGLTRLKERSRESRVRERRRRSWLFYAGLIVLLVAVESPIDYWSSSYFSVHMVEHLLLSFAAPVLVVAGAPWIPLQFALPVRTRRSLGRFFYLSPKASGFRTLGRIVRNPWVALLSFNAAMLVWHIPSWFDLSERNSFVHIFLMHGSFFVTGVLFWLQILRSFPMKPRQSAVWQVGAILGTNVAMTFLAMAMSIFTNVSWYSVYQHVPGVSFPPFADQQIGAAILWVCGDFWAGPVLGIIIRRAINAEGSLSGVIDRITHRNELQVISTAKSRESATASVFEQG